MHQTPSRGATMTDKDTECAVCEEGVTVERHTPKKLVSGVIYHFCSEECRDTFVQDPSKHTGRRRRRSLP